jgi:hypothetical protein
MLSRDVSDDRHTDEANRRVRRQSKYNNIPGIGHLEDGEVVVVKGSSKIVWRDGNKLYEIAGTEVT